MLRETQRRHTKHRRGPWARREQGLSAGRLAPETPPAPPPLWATPCSRHAAPGLGTRRTPVPARLPAAGRAERRTGRDSAATAGGRAGVGTEVGPASRPQRQGPRVRVRSGYARCSPCGKGTNSEAGKRAGKWRERKMWV